MKKSSNLEIKNKILTITLDMNEFYSFDSFSDKFSIANIGVRYSCIAQMNYTSTDNEISEWRTLGNQLKFLSGDKEEMKENLSFIHLTLTNRTEELMARYQLENENINEIRIIMFSLQYSEYIVKKKVFDERSLGDRKDLINISETKKNFNRTIPINVNLKELGKPLEKTFVNEKLDSIKVSWDSKFNFIDKLKLVGSYDDKVDYEKASFYEYYLEDKPHIVVINTVDSDRHINIYSKLGMCTHQIIDHIVSDSEISRTIGNVTTHFNDKGTYLNEINQSFVPVKPKRLTSYLSKLSFSDYRIGTMDLETYVSKDNSNQSKTYALGFYTKNDLNIFYIDEDKDSDKLIKDCLISMLRSKYSGYTFYVHNLGKYDITFILKVLISMNEEYPNIYSYETLWRNGKVLALNISRKTESKKVYTIKLVDSLNILNGKLSDLCKSFEVDVVKGIFPYKFVNENTLFYIGDKPDYNYYETDNVSLTDYTNIPRSNWSTKKETTEYLKDDLISLYLILDKFTKHVWREYGVHVSNCLTISSISMEIYLRRFYQDNIPLIKNRSVYNDIRNSYYGGITEVYIPYGQNLYYYDVNSLYPFAVFNSPMPGVNCKYMDNINTDIKNCKDLFGFYYCKIKTSDKYIGLIPVRAEDNSVIMPLGNIEGWYFSEELKFAQNHGYEIEIIHGYKFEKEYNTFNEYVSKFYDIKKNSKDNVMRAIAKSLLNNLLGRFGLELDQPVTQIVSLDEFSKIIQYRKLKGDLQFIGDKVLFTSVPYVSKSICDDNEVDYKTIITNIKHIDAKNNPSDNLNDVSVAISSAVTAYARIYMNKIKLDILNKKGKIYYTDTDSIVTDIKLEDNMVGKELGQLKLEHTINEAYFLSNKAYCLVLDSSDNVPNNIIKIKGYNRKDISVKDFDNMYKGLELTKERFVSTRNYSDGFTLIHQPRTIHFSTTAYKKREKLYKNGLWVNTKPLYIDNQKNSRHLSTYSVPYINKKSFKDFIIWLSATLFLFIMFVLSLLSDDTEGTSYIDDIDETVIDTDLDTVEYPIPYKKKEITFFNLFKADNKSSNTILGKTSFSSYSDVDVHNNTNIKDISVIEELYKDYINRLEKELEEKDKVLHAYATKDSNLYNDLSVILKEFKDVKKQIRNDFNKIAEDSKYNTPSTSANNTPITKFLDRFY